MSDGDGPSKESLREVKREYKARRKAEEQRAKDAKAYWDQQTGRSSKKGGGKAAAAVGVLVVAAVAVAALKVGPFAPSTPTADAASASPTPSVSTTSPASARSSASASPSTSATGAAPVSSGVDRTIVSGFATTPARTWKVGAAGIVAPAARQVGIFRPAQVREAYAVTAAYLRAAMLDPRVLYKGDLKPVLATFGPVTRAFLKKQVAAGAVSPADGIGWDQVANRFHPGDWRAAPEIRIKGRMRAIAQDSSLQITFVYVAAYWVVHGRDSAAQTITIRREGAITFYGKGSGHAGEPYYGGSSYTSSASVCGASWPYRNYVVAWTNRHQVPGASAAAPSSTWDPTDVDAQPAAPGCFHDASGFG